MVIENGYIEVVEGEDIGLKQVCNLRTNSSSPQYATDGRYIGANYTVVIPQRVRAKGVRLYGDEVGLIGTFVIDNMEYASSVNAYLLTLTRFD